MEFKLHLLILTAILFFNFVNGQEFEHDPKKIIFVLPQSTSENVPSPSETLFYFVDPSQQQPQQFIQNQQPKEVLYQEPIHQFINILPANEVLTRLVANSENYYPVQNPSPIFVQRVVTDGTEQLGGQELFKNRHPNEERNRKIIVQPSHLIINNLKPKEANTEVIDDSKNLGITTVGSQQFMKQLEPSEGSQQINQESDRIVYLNPETGIMNLINSNQIERTDGGNGCLTDSGCILNSTNTSVKNNSEVVNLHKVNVRNTNNNEGAANNNRPNEIDFSNEVLETTANELVKYFEKQVSGSQNFKQNVENVKNILKSNLAVFSFKNEQINNLVQEVLSSMNGKSLQGLINEGQKNVNNSNFFKTWKTFYEYVGKNGKAGTPINPLSNVMTQPQHTMPANQNQQFQGRYSIDNNGPSKNQNSNPLSAMVGRQFENLQSHLQSNPTANKIGQFFNQNFNSPPQFGNSNNPPNNNGQWENGNFNPSFRNNNGQYENQNFNHPFGNNAQFENRNFNPSFENNNEHQNSNPSFGNNNNRQPENRNFHFPTMNNEQSEILNYHPLSGHKNAQSGIPNLNPLPMNYYGHIGNPNFNAPSDRNNRQRSISQNPNDELNSAIFS